jgi:FkbM family methyltransferase
MKLVRLYLYYIRSYLQYRWLKARFGGKFSSPVVYYDVGSAGGPPAMLRFLMRDGIINFIGFEPGDDGWATGRGKFNRFFRIPPYREIKVALGEQDTEAQLHITRHPGCSSLFPPNADIVKHIPIREYFDVVKTEKVVLRHLAGVIEGEALPAPEMLKIDTQGYEYQVLSGLGSRIDSVVCIQAEAHFKELYAGQKTFCALNEFLMGHGFRLIEIKRQGFFGDELIEADAFWAREPRNEREKFLFSLWLEINDLPKAKNYDAVRKHVKKHFVEG